MPPNQNKRTRSSLVASVRLPPGLPARAWETLRRSDVLLRLAIAVFAALAMWTINLSWLPPFSYRTGLVPPRDIVAQTPFSVPDPQRTEEERRRRRAESLCIYTHDVRPLRERRFQIKDNLFQVLQAPSYQELDEESWLPFLGEADESNSVDGELRFEELRASLADDAELQRLTSALERAFAPFEEKGLLENLEHRPDEGSHILVLIHPLGNESYQEPVPANQIRIPQVADDLHNRVREELRLAQFTEEQVAVLATALRNWIEQHGLPTTLHWNRQATRDEYAQDLAELQIDRNFQTGQLIVEAGRPLEPEDIQLLRAEYNARVEQMSAGVRMRYAMAGLGMYVALYVLCGTYLRFYQPKLLQDPQRYALLLGMVVVTVACARLASIDTWRAEAVPLVLFGMAAAIAYQRETALLLSAAVALLLTISLGQGLAEFVILVASVSSAVLLLGRVRSRTKLLYVGLGAGLVAFLTAVGVGTLMDQAYGASAAPLAGSLDTNTFLLRLLAGATWYGACAILAGVLMTGLLPFVERGLDVQTDLRLLELGDASHPLLQELARRAPGTYNHSINVASLGAAAADSIGANGLLVRVAAYFHDIGKMLKPGYFVENQSQSGNRHDALLPAMSTLVIIAHVKDGADLARQHHLPQSIIDFIEQHHGTTLVEYFYLQQAARQREEDPESPEVDENNFRYPGPKPQTRETGVIMLADAVESASRTLADPTPARIENLVHEIVMKRLLDGQFDECGLTLQELHTVEASLVKSLTAVYHGRVKYPDRQQTA